MICRRYLVTGKVQGVFFRQSTVDVARQLRITGWCRNLSDGSVEVYACGDEAMLAQLQSWLAKGPPSARVRKVERFLVDMDPHEDFEIRR